MSTNQFIVFNKIYFQVMTSAINEPTFENQFCCYTMSDVSQDWEKMLVRLVMLSYENDGEKMADLVIHVHCVWERCAKHVCIYRNISKNCMTRLKKDKPCFKKLIFLARSCHWIYLPFQIRAGLVIYSLFFRRVHQRTYYPLYIAKFIFPYILILYIASS